MLYHKSANKRDVSTLYRQCGSRISGASVSGDGFLKTKYQKLARVKKVSLWNNIHRSRHIFIHPINFYNSVLNDSINCFVIFKTSQPINRLATKITFSHCRGT